MVVTLRRIFWLAVLGGAGYVGWTALQRRAHAGAITTSSIEGRPMGAASAAPTAPTDPAPTDPAPTDPAPATSPAVSSVPSDATNDDEGDLVMQFAALPDEVDSATASPKWVAPVDGSCPDGYPIKGNANSGIYHVPGGRFYDRTIPERCYAHTADAEADGYRRAKA